MKQSLYKKIRTVVEAGQIAITQWQGWEYVLWSSMADNWAIRVSVSNDDIAFCYNNLWKHIIFKDEIEKFGWERYIWIYERPLWRPKVGDRVQVSEKIKDSTNYNINPDIYKECVWWPYIVDELLTFSCTLDCGWFTYSFPYDCIAPRVSPDE